MQQSISQPSAGRPKYLTKSTRDHLRLWTNHLALAVLTSYLIHLLSMTEVAAIHGKKSFDYKKISRESITRSSEESNESPQPLSALLHDLNSRRGFGQNESLEVKSKSLHKKYLDNPVIKKDISVEDYDEYMFESSEEIYYDEDDDDDDDDWLFRMNVNDYVFQFGLSFSDSEDEDEIESPFY